MRELGRSSAHGSGDGGDRRQRSKSSGIDPVILRLVTELNGGCACLLGEPWATDLRLTVSSGADSQSYPHQLC